MLYYYLLMEVLYASIDQKLVNSLHGLLNELWNRWIRLSCYYNSV